MNDEFEDDWDDEEDEPTPAVAVTITLDGPRTMSTTKPDNWTEMTREERDAVVDQFKRDLLTSVAFSVEGTEYAGLYELPPSEPRDP